MKLKNERFSTKVCIILTCQVRLQTAGSYLPGTISDCGHLPARHDYRLQALTCQVRFQTAGTRLEKQGTGKQEVQKADDEACDPERYPVGNHDFF